MGYRFYFSFPLTLTSEVCLLRWPKQLDCFSVMNKEILPSFPDISQIPPLSPIFFPINNCCFIKSFTGILCSFLYYIAIRVLLFTGHVPFLGCKFLQSKDYRCFLKLLYSAFCRVRNLKHVFYIESTK